MIALPVFLAAAMVLAGCPSGKDGGQGSGEASAKPGKPVGPLLEVQIDSVARGPLELEGGIIVRALVLDEKSSGEGSVKVRVIPSGKLPAEVGGVLRVSPEIEIAGGPLKDILLAVEIPFSESGLPGGIEPSGIYGADVSGGAWRDTESFIVKGKQSVCSVLPAAPARLALLADARHYTPEAAEGDGIAAAALLNLRQRVARGLLPEAESAGSKSDAESPEKKQIYYLKTGEVKISLGTSVYILAGVKKTPGMPIPLAVMDKAGKVVRSPSTVRDVLLAYRLREILDAEKAAKISAILDRQKLRVEAMAPQRCSEGYLGCLAIKSLGSSIDELRALLGGDLSKKGGDELVDGLATLVWVSGELQSLSGEGGVKEPAGGQAGQFKAAEILAVLRGGKKAKGKAPAAFPYTDAIGLQLDQARKSIGRSMENLCEELGVEKEVAAKGLELLPQGPGRETLLQIAGQVYAAVGYGDVLETAALLLSSKVDRAPSPDTQVGKFTVSGGSLVVGLKGTDADGRVAGYRYWIDDPKLPGIIKGGSSVKINLQTLGSGLHLLFAAAIDDDGQEDDTPGKFSFYVRRIVEVSVDDVRAVFNGPKGAINSEHHRAAVMYAKEVEAGVSSCAQEHFRFGIDGKGTIKTGMKFSGGAIASVAGKRTILTDSYKNKALSGCVIKALRSGKLRYGQPWKPGAGVQVTFEFNPQVLFFDAKSIADSPGKDAMAAVVFNKCVDKAMSKIEGFCRQAVSNLPGPWDELPPEGEAAPAGVPEQAAPPVEGAGEAAGGESAEKAGEPAGESAEEAAAESAAEAAVEAAVEAGQEAKQETKPAGQEEEDLKIPKVEFDPMEVMKECVKYSVKYLVAKCASGTSQKRQWCIDSCIKMSTACEKKCKGKGEMEVDVTQCTQECWSDLMLSCSGNCVLKNTPFEGKEEQ